MNAPSLFTRGEEDCDARRMPNNIEAEAALLGAVLFDNSALTVLADHPIEARHFYEPFHERLFAAMREVVGLGRIAEPIGMMERFRADPAFIDLGGLRYLADLVDTAPPAADAVSYAHIVYDQALRRDLQSVGRLIAQAADDQTVPAVELVASAERAVTDLARGADPGDTNLLDARSAAEETMAEFRAEAAHGRPKGMMTGLRCIDRRLRGLRPGHLIIIAGRPSMAKSGLARQAANGAAARNPNHQFPFFCLEMARREMSERTLSELSYRAGQPLAYHDMNPDKMTPMELDWLDELVWKIPRNFILDDTATLSVEYVRRRCWALQRKGPIGAIFIDYLQIMERPAANGRNDAAVIGEMTSALKRLGRELGCAVVLLSQINRGVESRDDKRPQLSDLRESGSIEQDANSVLFPFREVYYLERAEPKAGTAEHTKWEAGVENLRRRMDVLCAKNRGGAIGSDQQDYFAEYDAITDVRGDQ